MGLDRVEGETVESWLAHVDFTQCTDCTVSEECRSRNRMCYSVSPRGPIDAPIVIVGEAPGKEEEDRGEVFVGAAGRKLEEYLAGVGIDSSKIYITNTIKCRPVDNRTPTSDECKVCRDKYLKEEILAHPRKLIVTLGNIGTFGVTPKGTPSGIMAKSGLFVEHEEFNCLVLPCIHPAAVLRNPSNGSLMQDVANKIKSFIDNDYTLPGQRSVIYKSIRDLDTLEEFIREVEEQGIYAFDTETTGFNYEQDKILCLVFSTQRFTAWYLPLIESDQFVWSKQDWAIIQERLRTIFENKFIAKIGHNIKFDNKFLISHFGWKIAGQLHDTMLMHHIIDENTEHGLKYLAARYTDMGNYAQELEDAFRAIKRSRIPLEDKHYGKIDSKLLETYSLADADATFRLYELFKSMLIPKTSLYNLYSRNIMEVNKVLTDMELVGVNVDDVFLQECKSKFAQQLIELEANINKYSADGEVNVRSVQQLRKLLYEDLNLPVLSTSAKGDPSTDEATLQLLKEETHHELLDLLLSYREIGKLYSTYVVGLDNIRYADGRVHTSYRQHGTVTGRLASRDPNLQNIPRPDPTGNLPTIRHLFIPTEDWLMIQSDYAQMELRAWAQYTKEEQFVAALTSSDVHSHIGSILLNKPPEEINKDERTKVKTVVFGIIYGRGPKSVAEGLNISYKEAKDFIDLFLNMFPLSSAWLLEQEEVVKRDKKVSSFFGRERHLPEVDSTDDGVAAQALRQGRNSPVQALASDITNGALVRIAKTFNSNGMQARPLMQVHDCIIVEAPKPEIKEAYAIVKECMLELPKDFIVPLNVDLELVDRWDGNKIDINSL